MCSYAQVEILVNSFVHRSSNNEYEMWLLLITGSRSSQDVCQRDSGPKKTLLNDGSSLQI